MNYLYFQSMTGICCLLLKMIGKLIFKNHWSEKDAMKCLNCPLKVFQLLWTESKFVPIRKTKGQNQKKKKKKVSYKNLLGSTWPFSHIQLSSIGCKIFIIIPLSHASAIVFPSWLHFANYSNEFTHSAISFTVDLFVWPTTHQQHFSYVIRCH